MFGVLSERAAPTVSVGRHCDRPHECPFKRHCWTDVPADSVFELPKAKAELLARLSEDGVAAISAIPEGTYDLSPLQEIVRSCVVSGSEYVDVERLSELMEQLEFPICFLDFETFGPRCRSIREHGLTNPSRFSGRRICWTLTAGSNTVNSYGRSAAILAPHSFDLCSIRCPTAVLSWCIRVTRSLAWRIWQGHFPKKAHPLLEIFCEQRVDLLAVIRQSDLSPRFPRELLAEESSSGAGTDDGLCTELAISDGWEAATMYQEMISVGHVRPSDARKSRVLCEPIALPIPKRSCILYEKLLRYLA